MPRLDPRFNAFDVIRFFEENLPLNQKRLVIAWFFSLIPIKEPKVDVLQLILDLVALVPVAGTASRLFQISLATAQAAKDIAEIIGLDFEEEEVELAKLKFELETLEKEFKIQREELLRCQVSLDEEKERANALLGTIELLEDEIRDLIRQVQRLPGQLLARVSRDIRSIRAHAQRIINVLPSLPPSGTRGIIRGRAGRIILEANDILEGLS